MCFYEALLITMSQTGIHSLYEKNQAFHYNDNYPFPLNNLAPDVLV